MEPLEVGTKIRSAPESSDVKRMKMTWRGEIIEVFTDVKGAPDGCCYVTVGYWDGADRGKRPTSRQLWRDSIVVDDEEE